MTFNSKHTDKINVGFSSFYEFSCRLSLDSFIFLPKVFWCSWRSSLWFIHWASSVMTQAYVIREINISNCKGSDLENPAHRHSLGQPLQVPPLFWGPGRQCLISQKLAPRNTPSGRRKGQTDVEENVLGDIVEESRMCKLICQIWQNKKQIDISLTDIKYFLSRDSFFPFLSLKSQSNTKQISNSFGSEKNVPLSQAVSRPHYQRVLRTRGRRLGRLVNGADLWWPALRKPGVWKSKLNYTQPWKFR